MPFVPTTEGINAKFPQQSLLVFDNFKRGVITLIDQSKLPKNALREADNIYLTEDGAPTIRPGIDWFGAQILGAARTGSPVVTTNLVQNPNFETNSTFWSSFSGGTVSRVTTQFYSGIASLQVVGIAGGVDGTQSSVYAVSPSNTYTVSAYVRADVGVVVTLEVDSTTAADAYVAAYTADTIGDGSWKRVSVTMPLGATEAKVQIYLYTDAATTFHVDAVMLTQTAVTVDYFDGTTTDTADIDYAWTGTVDNSTSTKSVYTMTTPSVDGFDTFDTSTGTHIVAAINGSIYRSLDDGVTWTLCTGGTYTSGATVSFNQYNGFLYITTGVNAIVLYDGTTVLTGYTNLATPAAPGIAKTGLAATTYTYYYKISLVNKVGFSNSSPAVSIQTSLTRDQWDRTANFVTLTFPAAVAGQERVDVFFSENNVDFYYINSQVHTTAVPNATFKDDATAPVVPSTLAPTANTTTGPTVAELTNIGTRMFGVRDPANRYRIWFTSGKSPLGAFSTAYDGGYLDWQLGGKYFPVKCADYRDKSGSPIATIWCDSNDGEGCIIQMGLDAVDSGTGEAITIPSAYKLAGSRGTNAPGSVINVLNDYMYYNSQAFYNLGNRVNLNNILSTDESSSNIRTTVKQINPIGSKNITAVYYEAKVFFSVPYGSALTNSHTIVYDTEQKAWLPTAFTVGFKKFLRYTDTTGKRRLLALKVGDNRLSYIDESLTSDYGVAFRTSLLTGLMTTARNNRFEFQTVEKGYLEFSNPQSKITVDVLGIERRKGYTSIKTVYVENNTSVVNAGWDTFDDDGNPWDDTSITPTTYSESSVKRYFNLNKELNAIQWHITTDSASARYVLRTLQSDGTDTQSGPPKQWRIKN